MSGMKVDLVGMLQNAADAIKATVSGGASIHSFALEECSRHVEQVRKGEATLAEFCALYCLPAPAADAGRRIAVRIWSGEHRAWWRSNRSGYTTDKDAAGIYSFEEAYAATRHCGPEKRITLQIIGAAIEVTLPDADAGRVAELELRLREQFSRLSEAENRAATLERRIERAREAFSAGQLAQAELIISSDADA